MAFRPLAHFLTITRHRHMVISFCWKSGLFWQGLRHDLSKYLPIEFVSGARYFQGTRSPNDLERRSEGYSKAWLHHKGHNKHHVEYWTDYPQGGGRYGSIDMPLRYIVESVCDRLAACHIYLGDEIQQDSAYRYYLQSLDHIPVSEARDRWFRYFLEDSGVNGEDHCFNLMKETIRSGKIHFEKEALNPGIIQFTSVDEL